MRTRKVTMLTTTPMELFYLARGLHQALERARAGDNVPREIIPMGDGHGGIEEVHFVIDQEEAQSRDEKDSYAREGKPFEREIF